ncbi:MAG: HdeD family acid-resistance protein [Acutalibacteraceae bacterium]|jgi:uncharacterized membrane protein HdeD (DUF308 family)
MFKQWIKDMKKQLTLTAIFSILLGLVLAIWPDATKMAVSYLIGAALVVFGVIQVVRYFVYEVRLDLFRYDFVSGLILLGAGVFLLMRPEIIVGFLPVLLGIAIVIDGAVKIQQSMDLLRAGYRRWWLVLLLAALALAAGVVLLINPFEAASTLVLMIGIVLIYNGVTDLWTISRVSGRLRQMRAEASVAVSGVDVDENGVPIDDSDDRGKR